MCRIIPVAYGSTAELVCYPVLGFVRVDGLLKRDNVSVLSNRTIDASNSQRYRATTRTICGNREGYSE